MDSTPINLKQFYEKCQTEPSESILYFIKNRSKFKMNNDIDNIYFWRACTFMYHTAGHDFQFELFVLCTEVLDEIYEKSLHIEYFKFILQIFIKNDYKVREFIVNTMFLDVLFVCEPGNMIYDAMRWRYLYHFCMVKNQLINKKIMNNEHVKKFIVNKENVVGAIMCTYNAIIDTGIFSELFAEKE